MKKIFVMFATVAAFTLASCGGNAEQKATEDTKPAVENKENAQENAQEMKAAGDSATKKIEGATKEGVQEVKEAAKEGAAKVEGATKEGVKEVKEEVKK